MAVLCSLNFSDPLLFLSAGLRGGVLQLLLLDLHRPELRGFLWEDSHGVRLQSPPDQVAPHPHHPRPRVHHSALLSAPERQHPAELGQTEDTRHHADFLDFYTIWNKIFHLSPSQHIIPGWFPRVKAEISALLRRIKWYVPELGSKVQTH